MANIINHHGNVEEVSDPGKWDRLTEGERRYQAMRDAARELYEALEKARSGLESILPTGYPHPLMVEIDAALAKARGEQ